MSSERRSMQSEAIGARLQMVSSLSDLASEHRLDGKLDMSAEGIVRRLQEVAALLELSVALAASRCSDDPCSATPRALVPDGRSSDEKAAS